MRRALIAAVLAVVAAPMLSGCIIIATDEPSTRVVHTSSAPEE